MTAKNTKLFTAVLIEGKPAVQALTFASPADAFRCVCLASEGNWETADLLVIKRKTLADEPGKVS